VYQIPNTPGSYVFIGELPGEAEIELGAFGRILLHAGIYFYCGSARGLGGLHARIARHIRNPKKKHWHFDYLRPYLILLRVWWCGYPIGECDLCRLIIESKNVSLPVAGFGSSDCCNSCRSHLAFVSSRASLQTIETRLVEHVPDLSIMALDENLLESS